MKAPPHLAVRIARPDDEERIFRWRNEPWIVQGGASQRPVSEGEHRAWYRHTLAREVRELFIVEIEGAPAGTVRYDIGEEGEAEISTYLFPAFWGKGYGRKVFLETAPAFCVRRGIRRIMARVLSDNARSLAFFAGLGFRAGATSDGGRSRTFHLDSSAVIRHSACSITEPDIAAVVAVLKSGHIAQGPRVAELESRWCRETATTSAAAVGSGLGALRLALGAVGVRPGDEVILPAYSCVALMNAVLALGAVPVLADIVADAWILSMAEVQRRVTSRTRAIIAVHLFGAPAPVDQLLSLGLPVIEDCAHGIGGRIGDRQFGGLGTLSTSSFYATKMLAGGEGGIVAGGDPDQVELIRRARDYGDQAPDGRHLNDKMTDIEAALVLVQLSRLTDMLSERERLARSYAEWLRPLADEGFLKLPPDAPGRIWYRFAPRLCRHRAREVTVRMLANGVRAEQPVWDLRGTSIWRGDCPVTDDAFDRVLSLPLYPGLSAFDQQRVCASLNGALRDE